MSRPEFVQEVFRRLTEQRPEEQTANFSLFEACYDPYKFMQLLWAEAARAEVPENQAELQRRIREKAKRSLSKGYSDGRLGSAAQRCSASRPC